MKKFKFTCLNGPQPSYMEAATALQIFKAQRPNDKVVMASYHDFAYHELDETLTTAWKEVMSPHHDVRIKAKGFFICIKEDSTQPKSYFDAQILDYQQYLDSRGAIKC